MLLLSAAFKASITANRPAAVGGSLLAVGLPLLHLLLNCQERHIVPAIQSSKVPHKFNPATVALSALLRKALQRLKAAPTVLAKLQLFEWIIMPISSAPQAAFP